MTDELDRFVAAQAPHLDAVKAELAAGRKRSHWMWFVFPQLRGLGHSYFDDQPDPMTLQLLASAR